MFHSLLQFNHLRFPALSWMLHFGKKRAEEEDNEEEEEEEGWKTCRSLDFCSPDSLGLTQEAAVFAFRLMFSRQFNTNSNIETLPQLVAGSGKRDGKSTTPHGFTSCGRSDSLLPTRGGQVHPHILSYEQRVGNDREGEYGFWFPPASENTFLGPFLSDIPSLARWRSNHHIPARP